MTGPVRRWLHLTRVEGRLQARYGIVSMAAALTVAWTALLALLPTPTARTVAPLLMLVDTASLGTFLAGALVILERGQGMAGALAVSPARTGERLAARLAVLTVLVVGSALPIALAGRPAAPGQVAVALAGVALTGLVTMLVAMAVAARHDSVLGFLTALPLILLPLLVAPIAHAIGLRHAAWYAVPTTGAADLISGAFGAPTGPAPLPAGWLHAVAAGYLLVAVAAAGGWAHRRLSAGTAGPARTRPAPGGATPRRLPRGPAWPPRSLVRMDLARVRRDPLLVTVLASPLLLGAAVRFAGPAAERWLADTHGIDLAPHRPALLALMVVLHVPVTFGMVGALLVLDDVDDRALTALRVSPLTLPRYLGHRAALVTAGALAGLAVATPLTGLVPAPAWPRLVPALVLAAPVAALTMLATLAFAGNKVEGVAVLKLLGLPLYLPVVTWWLAGPVGWPFAATPTWWVVRSLWAGWSGDAPTWPWLLGGVTLTTLALRWTARRAHARLARAD